MVDGAKFKSYDSGSHIKKVALKMATERKIHKSL